jgi:hypothetical protein
MPRCHAITLRSGADTLTLTLIRCHAAITLPFSLIIYYCCCFGLLAGFQPFRFFDITPLMPAAVSYISFFIVSFVCHAIAALLMPPRFR